MRPAIDRRESASPRLPYAVLAGLVFLAAVAVLSLPAARGASVIGPLPLWLLAWPAASLAALALRDRLVSAPRAASTAPARRRQAHQAQRRRAPRQARQRARAQAA